MSTSNKLLYLNTTKSKIKDSINLTGANITNETTFRNYAVLLKDKLAELLKDPSPIWDNFPKTNATGTDIHVNTYNSLFEYELEGETTQDGTPTPDSPIEVVNVTGLQEINLVGKNLCDIVLDDSIANTILYKQYTLQPNTQYAISSNTYWQEQNIANVFVASGTSITPSTNNNGVINSRIITSDNNGNIIMGYRNYSKHFNYASGDYYIQIEKNSVATEYEPYKGKSYELNLGKNLYDYTNFVSATNNGITATNNNGTISCNGTASAITNLNISTKQGAIYLPKGTYTLSANNSETISSGGYLWLMNTSGSTFDITAISMNVPNAKKTFTFTEDKIVLLQLRFGSGQVLNNFEVKPQLEKGSQATSYSEYFEPIFLGEIGSYKDKIFKGVGYNLYNKNANETGTISQTDGQTISPNSTIYHTPYIAVETNITYNATCNTSGLTIRYFTYDSNHNYIGTGLMPFPWTIPSGVAYVRLQFNVSFDNDLMFFKGTSLPYEPYNAKDKWYLHKEIGSKLLNGTENWGKRNDITRINAYIMGTSYVAGEVITNSDGYCNYFKVITNGSQITGVRLIDTSGCGIQVQVEDTIATTTSAFKEWLTNHNLKVYYPIQNPTTTEITNNNYPELYSQLNSIELLDGENNITITGDLAAILNLTVLERE